MSTGVKHIVIVCLIALVAAGCGSSSSSSTGANTSTVSGAALGAPTGAQVAGRVALAKCLRGQGIDVPDPNANGTFNARLRTIVANVVAQVGQTKLNAALTACRQDVVKSFPRLALTPQARAQRLQQAMAFVRCMRSHQINLPDPTSGLGGGLDLARALSSQDQNSPVFKSALKSCVSLVANGRLKG